MKKHFVPIGASALLVLFLSTEAMAVISDVNGLRIQLRRFNDYASSTLVVVPAPPPPGPGSPVTYGVAGLPDVTMNEGPFGAGGFANQHVARLSSTAGATNYTLAAGPNPGQSNDAFDVSFNVTMTVGVTTPRKEAGFRMDSFIAGESFFFVTSDGEVAAFGGPLPFFSFGGAGTYVPGNTARLRMKYTPDNDANPFDGDASSVQLFYDANVNDATPPVVSPQLSFSNLENGFISGTDIGMYIQNQPNDAFPIEGVSDFSNVALQNIVVSVPEPACLGLVSLSGAVLLVRRRGAKAA